MTDSKVVCVFVAKDCPISSQIVIFDIHVCVQIQTNPNYIGTCSNVLLTRLTSTSF